MLIAARLARTALLALVLVLGLAAAGCGQEAGDPALVGTWGLADHAEIQERFGADGSWRYTSPVAGSDVAGSWDVDGDQLQVCGSFCSSYSYTVDGDQLTTIGAEGNATTWVRQ